MGSLTWFRLVLSDIENPQQRAQLFGIMELELEVYSTVYTLHFIAAFLSTKCCHADDVLHMV